MVFDKYYITLEFAMKINQIVQETTTAGSVAPVEHGFVKMQTRSPSVYGNTKAGSLFKGKKTNKPFANSINEGAMKQLSMDLKGGVDGLSDEEFQKKYKMTKQEARKELTANRKDNKKPEKVNEADLQEDDIIVVPGHGRTRKTGFTKHGQSRIDHEVEMARSDVLATMKNARVIYELLKNKSEEEGLEGWVQEKLIKANDYLNAVKEYYDEKMMQQESVPPAGVIGNGAMGEGKDRVDSLVTDALKVMRGSDYQMDPLKAIKTVLGDREYNGRRGHYNFYVRQLMDMLSQEGLAEGNTEVRDNTGKVVSWRNDTEWHKAEKNKKGQEKDPRGIVTHLSDVARRKTEKQDTKEGKIDFAKKIQKNVDKSNKAVVKTKKEVGSRVADIGAGGKEYNVKTDKAWDDAQKAKKAK